jgi:hypothetical protein
VAPTVLTSSPDRYCIVLLSMIVTARSATGSPSYCKHYLQYFMCYTSGSRSHMERGFFGLSLLLYSSLPCYKNFQASRQLVENVINVVDVNCACIGVLRLLRDLRLIDAHH